MKTTILLLLGATFFFSSVARSQIVKTDEDVREVYDFVFGEGSGKRLGAIKRLDRQRANLFSAELINGSCALAWAKTLMTTALKPGVSLQGLFRSFAIQNFSDCHDDIKDGKVYDTIRKTLARNFKSAFEIRVTTGEW